MGLLGLAGSLLGMIPKVGSPGGKKKGKSAKKSSKKKSSTKKKQRKSNKKKKKKKRKKKKKKWGKFFTKARKLKNSLSKSKLVKRAKKAIKKAFLITKKVVKKTKAAVSKAKQQVKAAVKQTKQVVKKQVLPAMKKAAQATTKAVKNAVKPKNLLNTLQTGLDIVGMVPVVGEVADGVNGIIYAARGDKVNAALSFGAMIPVVGNAATAGKWVNKGAKAAKGISESAQKANKGLLGNVKEKVNKQVSNVKTQIQAKVDEVKQQLRQLRSPEMELAGAGVNVRRIEDTGTVGRNTTTPSPKPSNSQPPQNGSNKKPDENKGTGNALKSIRGLDDILDDPSKLKGVKPDELHKYLKDNGYNPQPLSGGSLKGKTFEVGGGFKVNWGGDRILQYHPGSRHHGGVPYWKLSSGKTGTNRYDMQGNFIK
ncbi:hypothetical protein [Lysinibacillus odysseyi]|uniref:hypothetical protein n=1 Tax=Lysinibacillus odysseyi TaxID=202611 RepID=UPI00068AF12C|nr:hypothetical protein [Lysinibacillus odysseyi]